MNKLTEMYLESINKANAYFNDGYSVLIRYKEVSRELDILGGLIGICESKEPREIKVSYSNYKKVIENLYLNPLVSDIRVLSYADNPVHINYFCKETGMRMQIYSGTGSDVGFIPFETDNQITFDTKEEYEQAIKSVKDI